MKMVKWTKLNRKKKPRSEINVALRSRTQYTRIQLAIWSAAITIASFGEFFFSLERVCVFRIRKADLASFGDRISPPYPLLLVLNLSVMRNQV